MVRFKKPTKEQEEYILRNLSYDPITGVITRIRITGKKTKIGTEAGGRDKTTGYRMIRFLGRLFQSHHIAYFMYHGYWATMINHINQVRDDNRICNIEQTTFTDNNKNRCISSNNSSGLMGVSWDKSRQKWQVRIEDEGKQIHLGRFTDFFEACCVRKSAEVKYGFSPLHGSTPTND